MGIRVSDAKVWDMYQHVLRCQESGLSRFKYAKREGISYNDIANYFRRIIYRKDTHPELYARLLTIAQEYIGNGRTNIKKYVEKYKVQEYQLKDMLCHLEYLNRIEAMKANKERQHQSQELVFFEVPSKSLPVKPEPENIETQQLMEKQNDIEITISKGVRVLISPNIEPLKIIKIIELLKDL